MKAESLRSYKRSNDNDMGSVEIGGVVRLRLRVSAIES